MLPTPGFKIIFQVLEDSPSTGHQIPAFSQRKNGNPNPTSHTPSVSSFMSISMSRFR